MPLPPPPPPPPHLPTQRSSHNTAAAYALPNDAPEHHRLNRQATQIASMLGRGTPFLGHAHISQPVHRAADIGCGTGVATMQMAQIWPAATVYGVDLSAMPEDALAIAPENVVWVQGDVLSVDLDAGADADAAKGVVVVVVDRVFERETLGYVFSRMLILGMSDWGKYFRVVERGLQRGGVVEAQDLDWGWYLEDGTKVSDGWEWHGLIVQGAEKAGLVVDPGTGAGRRMEEAGLEVVERTTFRLAFIELEGEPESKNMASYIQEEMVPTWPFVCRKLLPLTGLDKEEVEKLTKQAVQDLSSPGKGLHMKYTVTVARKP